MAHLSEMLGDDCRDPASVAEFAQNGAVAYLSNAKSKGKGKGGARYPIRPSNLSIEDRRRKLADLKEKAHCKDCGRRGHWKGDAKCTVSKTQQQPRTALKEKTGRLSVVDGNAFSYFTIFFLIFLRFYTNLYENPRPRPPRIIIIII